MAKFHLQRMGSSNVHSVLPNHQPKLSVQAELFNQFPLKYNQYIGQRARFLKFLDGSERVQERSPGAEVSVCFTVLH